MGLSVCVERGREGAMSKDCHALVVVCTGTYMWDGGVNMGSVEWGLLVGERMLRVDGRYSMKRASGNKWSQMKKRMEFIRGCANEGIIYSSMQ